MHITETFPSPHKGTVSFPSPAWDKKMPRKLCVDVFSCFQERGAEKERKLMELVQKQKEEERSKYSKLRENNK